MNFKILENEYVRLDQLDLSNFRHLIEIASEPGLIKYSPNQIHNEQLLKDYVRIAVEGFYLQTTLPYIIYDKRSEAYAGSTRFGNIDLTNSLAQIGWTWLGKAFRGTGLNTHIKFLMLSYAFEEMELDKVEFRIDERNLRSRKAVEKIGATLEGILRQNVLMPDGFKRNTCCYGILSAEWPEIKKNLSQQIN